MPRVLRSEIDAIWPRRDSSAATKYSPATPARSGGIFMICWMACNLRLIITNILRCCFRLPCLSTTSRHDKPTGTLFGRSRSDPVMAAVSFSPRKKRQENARRRGATFDHRPPNFRPMSDVHVRLQASLRDALILGALRPWANAHGYLHPVAPRPRPDPIRPRSDLLMVAVDSGG